MQVIVDKHTVTIIKNEIVNEGEYNVQSCNFQFSSDYDGLPKIAIFKTGTVTKQIMLSGNTCITPEEVLQTTGIVGLGVYAYQTDGDNLTLRYSPTPAVFTVEPGSYDEGDAPTPPTPSVIEQLQEEITQNANNITTLQNITNTHTTQIGTLQTDVNNIKTEQITQNTNIQTNTNDISNIKAEQITQNNKIAQNTSDIATLNNNLTNYSLITETGSQIALNVNSSNYQMTAILKDKNGNTIYTSNVIDLPIESMIVNVTYDSTTKEIVFTLQNGTTLRVSVADLVSGLVSTDELNTILASYYTKAEIDTLLSGKVDTTTYTQGQATQDTNIQNNADSIENIESLIEQMPIVSGQGTDLSLQSVLNYRLMKFLPQGVSSQESTTGKNLFDGILELGNINNLGNNESSNSIYRGKNYIQIIENTTYTFSINGVSHRYCLYYYNSNKKLVSYTTSLNTGTFTTPSNSSYVRFRCFAADFVSDYANLKIQLEQGSTATPYEPYTGGIPAPNPSYPYPVNNVTGENSLVISNSDNSETQNYQLSLGNIELNSSPDGTIRDQIVGKPNGWYKREYIGKVVLDGSENWTFYSSSAMKFALDINGINKPATQDTLPNILSDKFKQSTWNNAISSDNYLITISTSNEILRIKDNDFSTLADFKAWLSTHNATIYYPLAQYTDIPITDTTLINQLNDIYNNAHSYNGVTNITTTYEDGNEQMYLDVEALAKGGSSTAETDPTVPSYVKEITQQNIADWNDKQEELVSGNNIKTINNESILGSGNITIQGGGASYTAGTNIEITSNNVINNKIPYVNDSHGIYITPNGTVAGYAGTITAFGKGVMAYNGNATVFGYSANGSTNSVSIGAEAGSYSVSNAISIGFGAQAGQNETRFGSNASKINKITIYTSNGVKEMATQEFVQNYLTTVSGYDSTKTQVLKNVNGTLTWVDE